MRTLLRDTPAWVLWLLGLLLWLCFLGQPVLASKQLETKEMEAAERQGE